MAGRIPWTRPSAPPRRRPASDLPEQIKFVPFDPATKMSEATAVDPSGATLRAVKGAFATVIGLAQPSPDGVCDASELEAKGFRVLAVAVGPPAAMKLVGIIALSDPPRADSAALITELHALGVRTVMVTGDAPATAEIVASEVGLDGAVCPPGPIPGGVRPEDFAVFAGVLPRESTTWSRRSRRAATPSACAATAPTTRPRCARRRWASRCRPRPMSPSRPPGSC